MAVVVAAAKGFWAWATATKIVGSITVAAVLKTVATIAVTQVIGRALAPKLPGGSLTSRSPLQMTKEAITSRRIIYGQTRVSGPLLFAHVSGASNEYLHLVVALAGHECEEIGDIYFNDELVPLDGAGNATGTFAGLARILKHLGSVDQVADANLVAETGGKWTNAHRLRGICYLAVRLKFDENKWVGGFPNISAIVKGRAVYDPRDAGTRWTDNPALCVRDYLVNQAFGMGVDASEIDDDSFIAAANACDEAVELAEGGTEPRYTCNGSFELSAQPATVLEKMVSSMVGLLISVGGEWVCHAGVHREPTVTLDENDLRAAISLDTQLSMRETCNRVRGAFSSIDENYTAVDATPVVNGTYLAQDGGLEIWRDLELPFTTSHAMAQRIFKIELEQSRQGMTLRMPCKLTALRVRAGDVVAVNNSRWGFGGKQFLVVGLKIAVDNLGIGVDLVMRETAAGIWDWNSGLETTYDLSPNTSFNNTRTAPMATGLALSTSNFRQKDGTIFPRLKVVWNQPADIMVQAGGYTHIEYKKSADATWLVWTTTLRGTAVEDYITDVQSGESYDVRVRHQTRYGALSADWTTATATVSNDTEAPSVPSGLDATPSPGSITVDWLDNAAEEAVAVYRVYRGTSADFGAASVVWVGRASAYTDFYAAPGVGYRYWVTAVDRSNNESAPAGPTAAVTAGASTGNYIAYIFRRSLTQPDTPTGDYPASWSDAPPTGTSALWMSRAEKTSGGTLVGTWSEPVRLTGEDGEDGLDGDSIQVEYSVDGASGWHFPFASGDKYMRQRIGTGAWSDAIKIVGEDLVLTPGSITTPLIAYGAVTFAYFVRAATASAMTNNVFTEIVSTAVDIPVGRDAIIFVSLDLADDGPALCPDADIEVRRTDGSVVDTQRNWSVAPGGTEVITFFVIDPDLGAAQTSYSIHVKPRGGGSTATPSARNPSIGVLVLNDRDNGP